MTCRSLFHARWFSHINGVDATPIMREWLTDTMSLTKKLTQRSDRFRIKRIRQDLGLCLADEYRMVGLPRRSAVQERDVLLQCDDQPVVFAHTIVPLNATAFDWPFFATLGERSLGTTLFGDPLVSRGTMQYARLQKSHPLMRRAHAALGRTDNSTPLYARRCLYRRRNGLLLVTEVFLDAIDGVRAPQVLNERTNEFNKLTSEVFNESIF